MKTGRISSATPSVTITTPTYFNRTGRLCVHCERPAWQHTDKQCWFDTTTFEPFPHEMTMLEAIEYGKTEKPAEKLPVGTVRKVYT